MQNGPPGAWAWTRARVRGVRAGSGARECVQVLGCVLTRSRLSLELSRGAGGKEGRQVRVCRPLGGREG